MFNLKVIEQMQNKMWYRSLKFVNLIGKVITTSSDYKSLNTAYATI